jgi:hypothetical protein
LLNFRLGAAGGGGGNLKFKFNQSESSAAGLDGRPLPPIGCRNTLALAHWQ